MIPKICLTASAFLIRENKVLLVKHKKLQKWLSPGGHIDENELPHMAAQREFLEETGLKIQIYSSRETLFHPIPIAINEHWVCEENYNRRLLALKNKQPFIPTEKWRKGCEKHLNFSYLAKLVGPSIIKPGEGESTEVTWFSMKDLEGEYRNELAISVFEEVVTAFELAKLIHS